MGTPEATGLKPADWRRTILHEHFHQWQATLPGYHQRIDALALAGDDQNGMWMINYAFPYKRDDVVKAHRQRIAAVHPDRGGSDAKVHEANAARDLLLSDLDQTD